MSAATDSTPEYRAAGTDLSERRRSGVSRGPLLDIPPSAEMFGIRSGADGVMRIGALTTIAAVAAEPHVRAAYPGLAAAAGGLATPQIRRMATIGGNIAQRNRCWYFRNPHIDCLKKGGDSCPARTGNHLYGVVFDSAPCAAPHPSTMAAALMAYGAYVNTSQRENLPIEAALGDGRLPWAETALQPGELIAEIVLPASPQGERGAYKRAIGRAYAEWPLVELIVRATLRDGAFDGLRIVAGGVAPVPRRLMAAEAAALGKPASSDTLAAAAQAANEGANPLPGARYKLDLLQGLVRDLLEEVASRG